MLDTMTLLIILNKSDVCDFGCLTVIAFGDTVLPPYHCEIFMFIIDHLLDSALIIRRLLRPGEHASKRANVRILSWATTVWLVGLPPHP